MKLRSSPATGVTFLTIFLSSVSLIPFAKVSSRVLKIGAVLASDAANETFQTAIADLSEAVVSGRVSVPSGFSIEGTSIRIQINAVQTALEICKSLLDKNVVAVIFDVLRLQNEAGRDGGDAERHMWAVPYTCEFYHIPVIGVSMRGSVLSNQYVHPMFLRTLPPMSKQSELWYELLRTLEYTQVIFIYMNDLEGQALLRTFRDYWSPNVTSSSRIEITKLISLEIYDEGGYENALSEIHKESVKVILLAAGLSDSEPIFRAAQKQGLDQEGYVWLLSEAALFSGYAPTGALGWVLREEERDPLRNIKDSVELAGLALETFLKNKTIGMSYPTGNCKVEEKFYDDGEEDWVDDGLGKELYNHMVTTSLRNGSTGFIQLNENGDRNTSSFDLMNAVNGSVHTIGHYRFNYNKTSDKVHESMNVNVSSIVWGGGRTDKPPGVQRATNLKVVTLVADPFIYGELLHPGEECVSTSERNRMTCPKTMNGETIDYCCHGYLVDLMEKLHESLDVNFTVYLVPDNAFGSLVFNNVTQEKGWNGLMGEVLSERADLIVAPFTVDPERAQYIDFTKPYKYLGLTIIVKKATKSSGLASFLQPFEDSLWVLVGLSVHMIALVLYLLDRFSPFGQLKVTGDSESDDALSLSSAIWFSWGVLLNSGIGEGTPKSFSARVLGMIWAGFAMIIVASYTANLAAFLVLDRPKAAISGIDDPRLRNPTDEFLYATVKHSAVESYFKRQVEFTTMYRTMDKRNYDSAEKGIEAVRANALQAFIWDSPRLTYEASQDCDLLTAGELFGRSSYAVAFKKNSQWTERISLEILSYHEKGYMEQLDNKWILLKNMKCEDEDGSPATLGLTNMAGVFMMVGGGIVIGFLILVVEVAYLRYSKLKSKETETARKAYDRWRSYVEKKKTLRKTWLIMKGDEFPVRPMTENESRAELRKDMLSGRTNSCFNRENELNSAPSAAGQNGVAGGSTPSSHAGGVTNVALSKPSKLPASPYTMRVAAQCEHVNHRKATPDLRDGEFKYNPTFEGD